MALALADLDSGLFLDQSGWTADFRLARRFEDRESVLLAAMQNKIKNAAAVILDGDPLKVRGFLGVTNPNEDHGSIVGRD